VTVPYYLLGFAVGGVYTTGSTKLSQFEPLCVVLLILGGRVVPPLAGRASHGNNDAVFFAFCGHDFSPFEFRAAGFELRLYHNTIESKLETSGMNLSFRS